MSALKGKLSALLLLASISGVEISSAATLTQDLTIGLSGPSSSTTLSGNKFNPSFGTLSTVQIVLGSAIFEAVGVDVSAKVSGLDFNPSVSETLSVSPRFFDSVVSGSSPPNDLSPFIGVGLLPYSLQYSAACGAGTNFACGTGWSGDLTITYTYTPSPSQVPLPAALPLFATGLGALGLLSWRRKRKAASGLGALGLLGWRRKRKAQAVA